MTEPTYVLRAICNECGKIIKLQEVSKGCPNCVGRLTSFTVTRVPTDKEIVDEFTNDSGE